MKFSNIFSSFAIAFSLVLGGVGYASAMIMLELLHNGVTDFRLVPAQYVDRYSLKVDSPSRIIINSEGWGSIGVNMILKAHLLDKDNNLVAAAKQRGGHFVINETLERGDYILEVEGQELTDRMPISNRYQVRTKLY